MSDSGAPAPQRATLVLPSTGAFDSRAWRIAGSLAARGHAVTIVARSAPGLAADEVAPEGHRIVRVEVDPVDGLPAPLRGLARRLRPRRAAAGARSGAASDPASGRARGGLRGLPAAAWRLVAIGLTVRAQSRAARRAAPPADLVHAMAYMGIPVGLELGRRDRAPVVYDARDIYTEARNIARLPGPLRRLFARIERGWAHAADRVITVNDPYADELARRLRVERPLVVLNCSLRREPPAVRPDRLRAALDLPAERRIVLYHGGLTRDRGIEQLMAAIPDVADAQLVLLGYGDLEDELRRRAADPSSNGRISLLPAVPPAELIEWVASADVVAMPIQPTTLNHRLTTPNKLFEAIAAGVPVVASDLPGMGPIVRTTGCGVVVDPTDPVAIAVGLRNILDASPERRASLALGIRAAQDEYHWERQVERLLAEYGRLTGRPW